MLADGRDVRDLASDTVRDGIAWCGAATHLFDGYENRLYLDSVLKAIKDIDSVYDAYRVVPGGGIAKK